MAPNLYVMQTVKSIKHVLEWKITCSDFLNAYNVTASGVKTFELVDCVVFLWIVKNKNISLSFKCLKVIYLLIQFQIFER